MARKHVGPGSAYRTFGGKRYIAGPTERTKRDANRKAKWWRGKGYNARVTRTGYGYTVYVRGK